MKKLIPITLLACVLAGLVSMNLPVGAAVDLFQTSPPPEYPDLVVQSVDGPAFAWPGQTVKVSNVIHNRGNNAPVGFVIKFYLSIDTTIIASEDTYFGQRTVSDLMAGASDSDVTTLVIPDSLALGNYYIGVIADASDDVEESDEDNNTGHDRDPIAVRTYISGMVYADRDGDRVRDADELGIGGVAISLWHGGSVISTTSTLTDGSYSFVNLSAGSYMVEETDPGGYASTTPNQIDVSLPPSATVDFGDRGIGTIQGVVFDDRNSNGVQDEGEPGVSGVTIALLQSSSPISTTLTDGNGIYRFTPLWLGNYIVKETDLPLYVSTTPNQVSTSLTSADQTRVVSFGDQALATIIGIVYNDLDGDGDKDGGESGIGGVEVTLTDGRSRRTTTSRDGSYVFGSLPLGTYTLMEVDPSGFTSTTPNTVVVTLTTPGQTNLVNFGDQGLPGTVSGTVFEDLNANGVQDTGEQDLANVTVDLRSSGVLISTTTTLPEGSYAFPDVQPGAYTVEETDPPGYASTTPNVVPISLPPAGAVAVDFGDRGEGTLSGVVYNDVNGNGSQDVGESGISDIQIQMLRDSAVINSTTTGVDGTYSFNGVDAGAYTLRETDLAGYTSTTPNDVAVSVVAGCSATANFGDQREGTVSGVVFNDTNGNGVKDTGEKGLSDVTVRLLQGDHPGRMTTTDVDGIYSFSEVSPGRYTLRETDLPDYVSTTPNDVAVSVTAGGSATARFGDQKASMVSGVVFNDTNGNGVQDVGESGLAGVGVSLIADSTTVITTTNGSGAYAFTSVTTGNYTVKVTPPAGFVNTTSRQVVVSVAAGGSATVSFGFQQVGIISGVAFNDANGNGVQDDGESGLAGVVISRIDGGSTVTVTTAADGSYLFSGVAADSYNISAAEVMGFARTTPGSVEVLVSAGGSASANFGYQQVGRVSGLAYNDANGNSTKDIGEEGISGVTVTLKTADRAVVGSTTTSGNGYYSFGDVQVGSYDVAVETPTGFVGTTPHSVRVSVATAGSASAYFGFQGQGTVSGIVFNDANGNGVKDAREAGIGGVTVSMNGFMVTTAGNGSYSFSDMREGRYTVMADVPPGFVRTTPGLMAVSLTAGGSASANFGFQGQGMVSGVVFNDANGSGTKDGGEVGIGGITVSLDGFIVTSAGDGSYSFSDVTPDHYTVMADVPAGFVRTTPGLMPVSVSAGGSASANFGFLRQGTVSGVVFNDANGNRIKDAGEAGIGGVTIQMRSHTVWSVGDGSYSFSNVTPGRYTVMAHIPAGFVHTTRGAVPVSVAAGGSATANFGFIARAQVSGQCFQDLDGDSERDPGEPGVSCQAILRLLTIPSSQSLAKGGLVASTGTILTGDSLTITSTSDGFYNFSDVEAGAYSLSTILPDGFTHWNAPEQILSVAPGGSASADSSSQAERAVTGRVFVDNNGNGLQDIGEGNLGGVTITLRITEAVIGVTTTHGDGTYIFTELESGNYTATETDPLGFASTTPNEVVVVVSAQSSAIANFGDQPDGTLSGVVYNDVNGDGARNTDEPGIGGVTITLKLEGSTLETTRTAGNGAYLFTRLAAGTYSVEEEDPEDFGSTTSNTVSVVIETDSAIANFGDQPVSSVSGVVFRDWNGNEVRDPDEVGISEVLITLSGSGTYTATTAGDGTYFFSEVIAGSYTVTEIDPEGFTSTTANEVQIDVEVDGSASANFGDLPEQTVSGVVYQAMSVSSTVIQGWSWTATGVPGIGGVTVNLRQNGGVIASTTTSGNGSYLFIDIGTGEYTVQETDPEGFTSVTPNAVEVNLSPESPSDTANFGDRFGEEHRLYLPSTLKNAGAELPGITLYMPLVVKSFGGS